MPERMVAAMKLESPGTDDCNCIEKDSIDSMIEKYKNTVYSVALTHTGSRADADDVFQEVFLRLFYKNPLIRDEEHLRAWLIRVTVNCSCKLTRSGFRKKTVSVEELSPEETPVFELPEENGVLSAVSRLPVKYRTVLTLFYFEDMTVRDIAKALRRSEGTVRMQLTRARALAKDFLKGEYFDETSDF